MKYIRREQRILVTFSMLRLLCSYCQKDISDYSSEMRFSVAFHGLLVIVFLLSEGRLNSVRSLYIQRRAAAYKGVS